MVEFDTSGNIHSYFEYGPVKALASLHIGIGWSEPWLLACISGCVFAFISHQQLRLYGETSSKANDTKITWHKFRCVQNEEGLVPVAWEDDGDRATSSTLIRPNGEARDQTCDPWLTGLYVIQSNDFININSQGFS